MIYGSIVSATKALVSPNSSAAGGYSEVEPSNTKPFYYVPIQVSDITIIIPVFSEDIPNDPDENGKLTLERIDADNDGVRDDIERYIASTYAEDNITRSWLYKYARVMNKILIQASSADKARLNSVFLSKETTCLSEARHRILNVKARFLNTKDRTLAYIAENGLLGGQVAPYSDTSC